MLGVRLLAATLYLISIGAAHTADVSVTEKTRTYRVAGDNIRAVVKSMTRNGPVSESHGKRALGLADYRYRTNIRTKRADGLCHVASATIALHIFYVLPKHTNPDRLNKSDRSRWRRIKSMIKVHEDRHGRYYRQFATELQRALAKMKPQKHCAKFRSLERTLRTKFEKSNARRNRRYDRSQYPSFGKRLKRLAPK